MKTEVKLQRGTRETVYEVDLPVVPKDHLLCVPGTEWTSVILSYIDITPASGPLQVLVVRA